jgi:hypothetical protein
LQQAAILAGNVFDPMNLKTIFIEGLPSYVQAGLRLHVTPEMSFDKVLRVAHNLGTSLRQTMARAPTGSVSKVLTPVGVKPFLIRGPSVNTVEEEEESVDTTVNAESVASEEEVPVGGAEVNALSTSYRTTRSQWPLPTPSPPGSSISVPTRGWASPGGSVMSVPAVGPPPGFPPRPAPVWPVMCYLCYGPGHYLMDCPRLPPHVRKEAAANRDAYQRLSHQQGPGPGNIPRAAGESPFRRAHQTAGHPVAAVVDEPPRGALVVQVVDVEAPSGETISGQGLLEVTVAENARGGN